MTRPTSAQSSASVFRGLGFNNNLTPAMVPSLTFEPSIGIAAGRIDKLGMDIRSFKEPLTRAIKQVMIPSIKRNFDEGGRPAWAPLSAVTLDRRLKAGITGTAILVRTGALKRVAQQQNIWTVTTTSAVVKDLPEKVWYGKVHQAGLSGGAKALKVTGLKATTKGYKNEKITGMGTRASAAIPARPFLFIQPEDEDAIMQIFLDWLRERIQAAWPS